MKKFTLSLKTCLYVLVSMIFLTSYGAEEEAAVYLQQRLSGHHDMESAGQGIKKFELHVTDKGFCRYKRFFNNGKIEYFSFNLLKYKQLDYLGSVQKGIIYLRTRGEDVIVQTYHDSRRGDIDSMARSMSIPVKNIEAEELNDLSARFQQMSQKLRQ
jgi:hypothetical protein